MQKFREYKLYTYLCKDIKVNSGGNLFNEGWLVIGCRHIVLTYCCYNG